ncbi:MAG: lysophospholipase L1-like esterase [Saprospiraceae bacterium]|jgi:lysophospholipase L1-like esterase
MQKKMLYTSVLLNIIFIGLFIFLIHALGGLNFLKYRINNRGLGAEYEHQKTLYENMPVQQGDIIFLGNSITAQCDWAELMANPKIKNRGIPGDTTDGILERVGAILSKIPSKLFLMIGVNDLLFHKREQVVENYKKIIIKIRSESPSTQLYLYSILPVNPSVRNIPVKNEDILFINKEIDRIAKDNQLIYIDLSSKFSDENGFLFAKFTSDGVHLNGDAYLLWKKEIEQYLGD